MGKVRGGEVPDPPEDRVQLFLHVGNCACVAAEVSCMESKALL